MRKVAAALALLIVIGGALGLAGSASAWQCGASDGHPTNPENCNSDNWCDEGFCRNRECQCGESDPGICGDRCSDRGLVCTSGSCTTQHVTDCRGILTGGGGGVISYCQVDACNPAQGNACSACNSCGMCNGGTIQCNGSCSASAPSNALCGVPPIGSHDVSDCTSAWGWSFDADYAGSIPVHIYANGPAGVGTFMGVVTANGSRPDVGAVYPGRTNSGWTWPIPVSLKDGAPHPIYAYAINVNAAGAPQGPNPLLSGSPRSVTCASPPTGTLTTATCTGASGSATDAQGSPVTVAVYDGQSGMGGVQIGTGPAAPNFNVAYPAFTNGQTHTVYGYGRDIPSGTWHQLGSGIPVTCAPTVSLMANPTTVTFGGAATLTWSVSNAVNCVASPGGWYNASTLFNGVSNSSGSSGPLIASTTFTLTCTNATGQSTNASVNVGVNIPPPTGIITNVADTDYCAAGAPGMVIDWRYEAATRPIGAYQVQVVRQSDGVVVFDTTKTTYSGIPTEAPVATTASSRPLWRRLVSILQASLLDAFRWLLASEAHACHGDCGGQGPGCAQACDEGGMAGFEWCVDSAPGDGYQTNFGQGKRNGDNFCGGWGACRVTNCYRDFECNSGFDKQGGGGDDGNGPNGWCRPSCVGNQGQACQSSPNVCGQRGNGTIQCGGGCSASTPPNSSCPPPSCMASPANQTPGANVTATGSGAFGAYSWNSGGGNPAGGPGNPRVFTYASTGIKTITVTDSATGRSAFCSVTICMANYNQPCQSAPNGCGITGSGTIQCNGTCNAVTPPLTACPAPACAAAPASAQTGQVVTATGSSGMPPYSWTSGGGNPAGGNGASFNTLYATSGSKTITVTDSNPSGAKSGVCNVNVGAAAVTTGTVITSHGQPLPILFDTDYLVRIKVWDADNRESPWSPDFAWSTKPGPWPAANFTYAPNPAFAELPITFTDASQNGPITGWSWDFGDGATSTTGPATQHTYAVEGAYNATLTATNAAGTCVSAAQSISAKKPLPTYREVQPGQPSPTQAPRDPTGGGRQP